MPICKPYEALAGDGCPVPHEVQGHMTKGQSVTLCHSLHHLVCSRWMVVPKKVCANKVE